MKVIHTVKQLLLMTLLCWPLAASAGPVHHGHAIMQHAHHKVTTLSAHTLSIFPPGGQGDLN